MPGAKKENVFIPESHHNGRYFLPGRIDGGCSKPDEPRMNKFEKHSLRWKRYVFWIIIFWDHM
jgi:hypothetical protein